MKKLWLDLEMAGTVGDFVENEKGEKKKKRDSRNDRVYMIMSDKRWSAGGTAGHFQDQ